MRDVAPESAASSVTGSSWFMYIGNRRPACRFSVRAAGASATKKRANLPCSASLATRRKWSIFVDAVASVSGWIQDAGGVPAAWAISTARDIVFDLGTWLLAAPGVAR